MSITGGGISELKNKGAVKSVQRGCIKLDLVVNADGGVDKGSQSVSINPVDTQKSLLIIYGENQQRSADSAGATKTILLGENSISFSLTASQYYTQWAVSPLLWQVVEFY